MLLVVLAAVVAVAAAIRSTWSPCGQSMLSTITPLGERGRGNRFATTAVWFVLGATVGGLTLGVGAALLALLVGALGISTTTALAVGGLLAVVAAALDAQLFGVRVPYHRRQVNEYWLDDYRAWVYGGGFGFQIGIGFATFIMTSAIVLLVALAALTGEPLVALGLGGLFGFTRGLGVLPGAWLTTPAKLASFHAKFDARAEASRMLVITVQLVVAVVAIGAVAGLAVAFAAIAVIAGLFALGTRRAAAPRELASP